MDYLNVVSLYEDLSKTSKRLEKTYLVSEFLRGIKKKDDVEALLHLIRGKLFHSSDARKIGVSSQLVMKALARSSGHSLEEIEKKWSEIGDLGDVTEYFLSHKKQKTFFSDSLTVHKVYYHLRSLADLVGAGSVNKKLGLISELLNSSAGKESKYIVRIILEDMRIGVADGTLRDALVWAFYVKVPYNVETKNLDMRGSLREDYNAATARVQRAYDLNPDFGVLVRRILEEGKESIDSFSLEIGKPFHSMLALKVENAEEALEAVGRPALCEYKLDGFRAQIHKKGKKIFLFTRRLEEVSKAFAELIPVLEERVKAKDFILDCEIIGYDPFTKKYKPFQEISQRIKRKHDIESLAQKLPVEIQVFDVLALEGKDLMHYSQEERRKILKRIIHEKDFVLRITEGKICHNTEEVEAFYQKALHAGHEGIMIKSLEKEYSSGRKVGGWVKLKPVLESLDLVIVGAEYGTGKRAGFLSSFLLAVRENNNFLTCGMVGTGIKEKEEQESVSFSELTMLLKKDIIEEVGKKVVVKAKVIVEVNYEELQKSPTYGSGYALRFPRIVRLRTYDKSLKEINTLQDLERIYKEQRGKTK